MPRRKLTDDEKDFIRANYANQGAAKVASQMDRRQPRTVAAWASNNFIRVRPEVVQEIRRQAGCAQARPDINEIDAAIRADYPTGGAKDIAERFNVRRKYVCYRAFQIGVKCTKAAKSELLSIGATKEQTTRQKKAKYTRRQQMERSLGHMGRLALYGKWRQDYPREAHEMLT
jgi:hypothetical protein